MQVPQLMPELIDYIFELLWRDKMVDLNIEFKKSVTPCFNNRNNNCLSFIMKGSCKRNSFNWRTTGHPPFKKQYPLRIWDCYYIGRESNYPACRYFFTSIELNKERN